MTRQEDIAVAVRLGVEALGFIFYPGSSRCLSLTAAKALLKELPPFMITVAVLVNPERAFVSQLLDELPIQCLQFHGDEPPEFCRQFQFPYIKALPVLSTQQLQAQLLEYHEASAILLDARAEDQFGGTGHSFDWSLVPEVATRPLILAGGLGAENVGQAVAMTSPYAVDVCSGIESAPGIKDHAKMAAFVAALRQS